MKRMQLIIIIFIFFLTTTPVLAEDILEQGSYWQSTVSVLNLYVDGSINPVLVNLTVDMDYVAEVVFHLSFTDTSLDYDKFGKGNGTPALVNGSRGYINGILQPFNVQTNDHLIGLSRTATIFKDDKATKGVHIVSPVLYYERSPPRGLAVLGGVAVPYFMFEIRDKVTDFCDSFYAVIGGSKWVGIEPDFNRDWLEDMFVFDNVLKYFALVFTLPAVFIFTWEPVGILLGLGIVLIELIILNGIWRKLKGDY